MLIRKIHHVACRCVNAKQTVLWSGKELKMGFVLAIAEDEVPSTGEPDPYCTSSSPRAPATSSPSSSCQPERRWGVTRTPRHGPSILRSRWQRLTTCATSRRGWKLTASRLWDRRTTSSSSRSTSSTCPATGSNSLPGHAGAAPHMGRNAPYDLAHQMLKSRQFGDPAKGLQINWTLANVGTPRNVIPAEASGIADARSLTNEDLDLLETALKKPIEDKLIPDAQIDLSFYRSRPVFIANAASRALARHAVQVAGEVKLPLTIRDRVTGGGTDAAFAGLRPKGGVLESFGLRGEGAHSNNDEYVLVSNRVPRPYLATRMVMDVGRGEVAW